MTIAGVLVATLIAGQKNQLTYVESSTGLNFPEWEGGMSELEFADIDLDGHVDFVSIGDHGSPGINSSEHGVMVYFGDGNGTWSVHMEGNFGYGGIAVGDINNDGFPDVGYGMHHDYSSNDFGDQLIEAALGDGTGLSWTPWDDGLATNGEDWGMFGTDFADIDVDGDLDLGSNSFGCCAGVHVYRNNMDGTWTQTFGWLGGNSDMRFVFGDLNNDGYPDFISANSNGAVYLGDGTGNFTPAGGNLPGPSYRGPSIGDIDNDGDRDLAMVTTSLEVWGWDEPTGQWVDYTGNLPAGGGYEETQLFDMNVDGFIDLAAFGNSQFTLWLGDGTGNWTEAAQFNTPQSGDCHAFRVGGDVDHNGYPDIILLAEQGTWWNYQNHLHCYKESSTASDLTSFPVFPGGLEVFHQHSVQFIDWLSAVPGNVPSWIRLEYSTSGNAGPWSVIADSLPNSGRYQWTVPQASSTECFIRITAYTQSDEVSSVTPQPFTIIGEELLLADFMADTTFGEYPFEVHFTDLSSGSITSWAWDFQNDGTIDSQEQNPIWEYPDAGTFSVALTVSDGQNDTTTIKTDYITTIHPASAEFTADPVAGPVPLHVNFVSGNPGSNSSWEWDFDNDGVADSYLESDTFTYHQPGLYSVKLIAGNGLSYDTLIKTDYITAEPQTGVSQNDGNTHALNVFPNPLNGNPRVEFHSQGTGSEIIFRLYHNNGTVVETWNAGILPAGYQSVKIPFDWEALPSGIYFLHMRNENRQETVRIFIL